MNGFALVNESSNAALALDLLYAMATELAYQQAEVGAWWQRVALPVSAASSLASIPKDPEIVVCRYLDTLDDPEALAYHYTDAHGRPCVDIGVGIILANGGTLTGPDSLLTATSHELVETVVDPYGSFLTLIPNTRLLTPLEPADWTQGDSYERVPGSGLFVSNFVGPRAFNAQDNTGPYDRMGLVRAPFTLRPGGYWSVFDPTHGTWQTVFGERMPDWKRAAKLKDGTRTMRRRAA